MINYKDLNISLKQDFKIVKVGETDVEVKQYLQVERKASIINLSVMGAIVDGTVDEVLMDAYLHVMLIENYCNIDFSDSGELDILNTFDELVSSGTLDILISSIPVEEYNYIFENAEKKKDAINSYKRSYAAAIVSAQELQQFTDLASLKEIAEN